MYATSSATPGQRCSAVAVALFALVVAGNWVWSRHQAQQELLALPTQQRQALYAHTLETLETVCVHANESALVEHCLEQAQFIARLPECGAACQELCRRLAPKPTK